MRVSGGVSFAHGGVSGVPSLQIRNDNCIQTAASRDGPSDLKAMLVVALLTSTGLGVPLPGNRTTMIGDRFGRRPEFAAIPNADVQTTQYGPTPEGFAEESSGIMNGSYSNLILKGNVRAYWTTDDTQHTWSSIEYKKLNLLGKSLRFTVDVAQVGCACNAALYLVAMGSTGSSDGSGYCDIQGVGGRTCTEIDLLEGNVKAVQSTLHTQLGQECDGTCNQYGCAVNWGKANQSQYGIGSVIDSTRPYIVDAAFDTNGAMKIQLQQDGRWLDFWTTSTASNCRTGVPDDAIRTVKEEMQKGMVLTVALWEAQDDLAWLNGNCGGSYPRCDLNQASLVFTDIHVIGGPPSPPGPGPSPSACKVLANVQCDGDDIRDAGVVSSADACCGACKSTQSCKAWTWNRGYDRHCYVKTACSSQANDTNCDSGFVGSSACTMLAARC